MIEYIKTKLEKLDIPCYQEGEEIRVVLPNNFGEMDIARLGDSHDTIVELVGYDWHTHGDLLLQYGGQNEYEAIINFVQEIFEGRELFLVELFRDGKSVDKFIEDDVDYLYEKLEDNEEVRIYNKK